MKDLIKAVESVEWQHKNIRTIGALISIIENLDYIPIEKLEELEEYFGI